MQNVPNELEDLAKEIFRQDTEIATWFLLPASDKMQKERAKEWTVNIEVPRLAGFENKTISYSSLSRQQMILKLKVASGQRWNPVHYQENTV